MRMIATRDAFGDAAVELGRENKDVFVIDCDISKSMKTVKFTELFPDRHINVGIAEQNAAGVAAGLAAMGKIPIISTYAVFGSMRMCEQIRTSVCYPGLNVKLACSHGGLTPCNDGVTHQGIEDMGIMRTLPNMTVVMGADYVSTKKLVKQAVLMNGPVYLRFTRDPVPVIYSEKEQFEIGNGKVCREGNDVTLAAVGDMVYQSLLAAEELRKQGISAEVLDIHTIKPLDVPLILKSAQKTGRVVAAEDHSWHNGLGSAVAEVLAETGAARLRRIGLRDTFAESGPYEKLLAKYGMDSAAIVKAAKELL